MMLRTFVQPALEAAAQWWLDRINNVGEPTKYQNGDAWQTAMAGVLLGDLPGISPESTERVKESIANALWEDMTRGHKGEVRWGTAQCGSDYGPDQLLHTAIQVADIPDEEKQRAQARIPFKTIMRVHPHAVVVRYGYGEAESLVYAHPVAAPWASDMDRTNWRKAIQDGLLHPPYDRPASISMERAFVLYPNFCTDIGHALRLAAAVEEHFAWSLRLERDVATDRFRGPKYDHGWRASLHGMLENDFHEAPFAHANKDEPALAVARVLGVIAAYETARREAATHVQA